MLSWEDMQEEVHFDSVLSVSYFTVLWVGCRTNVCAANILLINGFGKELDTNFLTKSAFLIWNWI